MKSKIFVPGQPEQSRQNKNLLYRHYEKPNRPTKEDPFSIVLFESPFILVLTVSRGHLVSVGKALTCKRYCLREKLPRGWCLQQTAKSSYHLPRRIHMQERHQLYFGLQLMSTEFLHPAIQTKIEQHFGGLDSFFHVAAQNFEVFSNVKERNKKNKK
jgi:hypothetical protein